jgi:hypothetical protein
VVADEVSPEISCFSSVRVHCVLEVSSVGQGTRLKFALQNVRQHFVSRPAYLRGESCVFVPIEAPFAAFLQKFG